MKGKKRNKFLAGFLAFVMVFLMLPVVPFTPVEAAVFGEEADVIRLPITIRDANQDAVLFQLSSSLGKGTANTKYVDSKIADNDVPAYTQTAIDEVAGRINTKEDIEEGQTSGGGWWGSTDQYVTNPELQALLLELYEANSTSWDSTTWEPVQKLEDAKTARAAADWMLKHLFVDGQFTVDGKTVDYTQTYPYYETLILQPGDYNGTPCYYYSSKADTDGNTLKTMFHYTSSTDTNTDEIYNTANGTTPQSGGWFPIDGLGMNESGTGASNDSHNFHHTTAGSGQFVYHADDDLFFAFTGDDDVYLYINGKLVIDDAGIHGEEKSEVFLEEPAGYSASSSDDSVDAIYGLNETAYATSVQGTQTWAEYLELEEGEIYDFHFFQMERNRVYSNFSMYTNINVVDSSAVPQKKIYQNGQELVYGSFVAQNSEVTYGFELTNNGDTPITNLTFEDKLLDVLLTYDEAVELKYGTGANTIRVDEIEYRITTGNETKEYSKFTTDTELRNTLAAGLKAGQKISIRGFKYNVGALAEGETTKTIVNTVYTTAQGLANNSDAVKTITGTATTRVRTLDIENKTFVLDYAKPMPLSNDVVFGNELTSLKSGITVTDKDTVNNEQITTNVKLDSYVENVRLDKTTGLYGTMSMVADNDAQTVDLTYTPKKVMNGIDSFGVIIEVNTTTTINNVASTGTNTINKGVSIVPANNVYYEDSFVTSETDGTVGITYTGDCTIVDDADNSLNGYPENTTTENVGLVHGWEENLADDTKYSDGSATKMEFTNKAATATFTFKGTGVDVYSRTNMDAGLVIATLTKEGATTATKSMMVDNYAASGDYYQIPTLSFSDLEHGTYTLKLTVNRAKKKDADGNYLANEYRATFWLDGIRVYNPLQDIEHTDIVKDAYTNDEINAVFTEIRDILITANNYSADANIPGAVFIDQKTYNDTTEGSVAQTGLAIGDYEEIGPKNEVYLAKDQAITFKITQNNYTLYQIGLKAMTGTATTALISNGTENSEIEVNHSTDLYYNAVPTADGYITIQNTGDSLLSVTKLKTTGDPSNPTDPAILSITEEEAVAEVMAFSLRRSAPYVVEEEVVEPEVPGGDTTEPEVPGDENPEPELPDVEIENPEPETPATPNVQVILKSLVNKLFNALIRWFGR